MKHLSIYRCLFAFTLLLTISCSEKEDIESNTIIVCGNQEPTKATRQAYYTKPSGERVFLKSDYVNTYVNDMVQVGDDIYCVGTAWNSADFKRAVYWKNGEPTYMTDGRHNASAMQIAVDGTDVYCVGREQTGSWHSTLTRRNEFQHYVAKCWKNGKLQYTLTKGKRSGCATGIYIDPDHRVHIVGYDNSYIRWYQYAYERTCDARYWIDGKRQPLDISRYSSASTITGNGDKIYISGWISNSEYDGNEKSVYWENEWRKSLSNSNDGECVFNYAQIINDNYYLCGRCEDKDFKTHGYWVNGQYIPLPTYNGSVHCIAGCGEDIYCAGNDGYAPGYWKNGKFKRLYEEPGILTGIIVYPKTTEE